MCVCIRNAKGCRRRRKKSKQPSWENEAGIFSLQIPYPSSYFYVFFSLFLFGTLSQIGSEWPVFVWGFRPLFFFSSFLNSLWCRTEQTSLLYSFLFFFLSLLEGEGGGIQSAESLTIFVILLSSLLPAFRRASSGGSNYKKRRKAKKIKKVTSTHTHSVLPIYTVLLPSISQAEERHRRKRCRPGPAH